MYRDISNKTPRALREQIQEDEQHTDGEEEEEKNPMPRKRIEKQNVDMNAQDRQ